jgi:hypothetical protein
MNEDVEIREDRAQRDDEDVRDVARDMARERRAREAQRPTMPADRAVDEGTERAERQGVEPTERRGREPEHVDERPVSEANATARANDDAARESLFAPDRASELRSRWSDVQARFVDDPREAVKAADALVDEVIKDLSKQFANERSGLESQWGRDQKVSTEDLRVALRRYRSFFERLLSV